MLPSSPSIRPPLSLINTNQVSHIQAVTQSSSNTIKFPKKNLESFQRKTQHKTTKISRRSVSSGPLTGQPEVVLSKQNQSRILQKKQSTVENNKYLGARWAAKKVAEEEKSALLSKSQFLLEPLTRRKTKAREEVVPNTNEHLYYQHQESFHDSSERLTRLKKLKCASTSHDFHEDDLMHQNIFHLHLPIQSHFNISSHVYEDILSSYSPVPMSFSSSITSFSDADYDSDSASSTSSSSVSFLSSSFHENSELIFDYDSQYDYFDRSNRNPQASWLEVLENNNSFVFDQVPEFIQYFSNEYEETKTQDQLIRPIAIRIVDPLLK